MLRAKALAGAVLSVLVCVVLLPANSGAVSRPAEHERAEDPLDPSLVPAMESFGTPILAPGESGRLNFTLRNRYEAKVRDLTATLEIYRYATTTSTSSVTTKTNGHPVLCLRPGECDLLMSIGHPELAGRAERDNSRIVIGVEVQTSADTPHGGAFDPSTYSVRVIIDYSYEQVTGNATVLIPLRLTSRGYVSDADWEEARRGGSLNLTCLDTVYGDPGRRLAGMATETSFIVREPVPQWPVYLLTVVMIACVALSMFLYAKRDRRRADSSEKTFEERSREPRERRRVPE